MVVLRAVGIGTLFIALALSACSSSNGCKERTGDGICIDNLSSDNAA